MVRKIRTGDPETLQVSAKGRISEQNARFVSIFRQSRNLTGLNGPKIVKFRPKWPENGPLWGPKFKLSDHRSELSRSKIVKSITSRLWRLHFRRRRKNVSMQSLHGQLLCNDLIFWKNFFENLLCTKMTPEGGLIEPLQSEFFPKNLWFFKWQT